MNKASKSEVFSWRITRALKSELEAAARAEKLPLSALLERIAHQWLSHRGGTDEEDAQRRRDALMACAGLLKGDETSATNARVREVMGRQLEAKHARRRPG